MSLTAPTPPASARPSVLSVLWDYMTTTDHKKIGILYLLTSVVGFCVAGLLAFAMRIQLAAPNQDFLVGQKYNEVLTAHGAIMIFFFLIPAGLFGFGNYLLPLMLGVRDVALPRVNNFAVWLFIFSLVLLLTAIWNGGTPGVGWTFYYPLSVIQEGTGVETLMVALILNGIGSLTYLSVNSQDVPVLQAIVLISAIGFVLINLIVDLLYPVFDPRLRDFTGAKAGAKT